MSNQTNLIALLHKAEFAADGGKHVKFLYQGEKDLEPRMRELRMGQAIESTGNGSWMSGHTEGRNGWFIEKDGIVYIRGYDVIRNEKGHFVTPDEKARPKCFRLDRVVFA